jgi:hypothetical protein
MTFLLGGKRMVIEDPCRGKLCQHVAFCDLRDLYTTRKHFRVQMPNLQINYSGVINIISQRSSRPSEVCQISTQEEECFFNRVADVF